MNSSAFYVKASFINGAFLGQCEFFATMEFYGQIINILLKNVKFVESVGRIQNGEANVPGLTFFGGLTLVWII